MITFRKAHRSFSRSRFWREDIRWYGVGPTADVSYPSHSLAFCLHGESQQDMDLYVMMNASREDLSFTMQEGESGQWRRVIDTSLESPDDFCAPGVEVCVTSQTYVVRARSLVVLIRP